MDGEMSRPTRFYVSVADPPEVLIEFREECIRKGFSRDLTSGRKSLTMVGGSYGTPRDMVMLHHFLDAYRNTGAWYRREGPVEDLVRYLLQRKGDVHSWLMQRM